MVRPPYYDSSGMKKGAWSEEEDFKLRSHVDRFGHRNWRLVPILAGLPRCGKSCRLRWVNYLKPGLRRGNFTKQEEDLIVQLHAKLGNKWSAIATHLPGRTDNEVKNHWHAHLKKHSSRRHRVGAPLRKQSSETSLSCITSSDGHHQETDVFSTATNPENMFLVGQTSPDPLPPPHQVDPIFTAAGDTNQTHFNLDLLQFADDEGQLLCDMDTLLCQELLMQNAIANESMNNCSGYSSDATGITSSTAESLESGAFMSEDDGQFYDLMLWH